MYNHKIYFRAIDVESLPTNLVLSVYITQRRGCYQFTTIHPLQKKKKLKVLKHNHLISFQLGSKISRTQLLLQKTAVWKYFKPSRLQNLLNNLRDINREVRLCKGHQTVLPLLPSDCGLSNLMSKGTVFSSSLKQYNRRIWKLAEKLEIFIW